LNIQIENQEKNCKTLYRLKLMDLDSKFFKVPDTAFDAAITLSATEFHKLCRDMNQIAEYVEIKCTSKSVAFTCKGDCAERTSTYTTENENGTNSVNIKHDSSGKQNRAGIVQGIYELRHLVLFTKCSNLCNDIQIFMKNDYPIVIKYQIATLGRILLCLCPVSGQSTKANFSDEDELYSDDDTKIQLKTQK